MQRAAAWMDRETRVVKIRHPFKAVVPSSTVVFETLGGFEPVTDPSQLFNLILASFLFI